MVTVFVFVFVSVFVLQFVFVFVNSLKHAPEEAAFPVQWLCYTAARGKIFISDVELIDDCISIIQHTASRLCMLLYVLCTDFNSSASVLPVLFTSKATNFSNGRIKSNNH